jgi:hypothetical protein
MAKVKTEEFKIKGEELLKKVKELIHEGNIRRIIIKNDKDKTIVEIPLTVGAIGAIVAPALAAIGTIAALIGKCTIIVEKEQK